MLRELEKRQSEALRLFEPLPKQLEFHMNMSRQRIIRGSNRAGKSLGSIVELAWAITGTHPQEGKYPKEFGRAIVVAQDEKKIGEVIWQKLGRAGAFRMVRDLATGLWRAWRPGDIQKGKAAPPLVPPRLIKDIQWISKKAMIPEKLIMKNGWEVGFYSGQASSDSIQGMDVDIVLLDEEIKNEGWFNEAMARLLDREGWFWWGATPRVGTQQLYDLHLRATQYAEEAEETGSTEVPLVSEVFLSIWDNPYITDKVKQDLVASYDEDERSLRIDGNFAITGTRVFEANFFPRGIHGCDPFPIPHNWTRFASIDPGFQIGAVVFGAVPPPKYDGTLGVDPELYGDFLYLYDMIYIRGCDAEQMAKAFAAHVAGYEMYAHLLDHHGGKPTEVGSGKTVEQQYREKFKAAKVRLPTVGTLFTYGSDDVQGRVLRIKDWLRVRADGTTKLRFIKGAVTPLVREMEQYSWKVVRGIITDKPVDKNNHAVDCLGYLVMYPQLYYHRTKKVTAKEKEGSYALYKSILAEERRLKRRAGGDNRGVVLA
jgi:hypothetical protein